MKDGEHSFEDDLALLVAKEDMIRIKAFCGMAEPCGIEACLAAAADAFHDDRLCRIEGDICSFVWHDDEKRCARFTLAADWTGRPCLDVYIEDRDLAVSDRETIRKLKQDSRAAVSGTLSLYNGTMQLRGCAVERIEGPSDYRKWCGEEVAAFQKWLETGGQRGAADAFPHSRQGKGTAFYRENGRMGSAVPRGADSAEGFAGRGRFHEPSPSRDRAFLYDRGNEECQFRAGRGDRGRDQSFYRRKVLRLHRHHSRRRGSL